MLDKKRLLDACVDFMLHYYELLGAYLDAMGGLRLLERDVFAHQEKLLEKLRKDDPTNATVEFLDKAPMTHELEDPSQKSATMLHRSSMGDFKNRVSAHGSDPRRLGEMMITLLYASWEDDYREKIANALGRQNKNELTSDLFGDLGTLRHAIVHNNGKATEKVSNAKILKWFDRGAVILISVEHAHSLWGLIDDYIGGLLCEQGLEAEINSAIESRKK